MLEFNFSTLVEPLKSVFTVGVEFYKALWGLFLRLWPLVLELVEWIDRTITN